MVTQTKRGMAIQLSSSWMTCENLKAGVAGTCPRGTERLTAMLQVIQKPNKAET